ncbi:hypothetical protein Peur_040857 [Populus x canadensis]
MTVFSLVSISFDPRIFSSVYSILRPECSNLLSVYQLVSGKTKEDAAKECQGLNSGLFKPLLTDASSEHLHPIQVSTCIYAFLSFMLEEGAGKAAEIAEATLKNVYRQWESCGDKQAFRFLNAEI